MRNFKKIPPGWSALLTNPKAGLPGIILALVALFMFVTFAQATSITPVTPAGNNFQVKTTVQNDTMQSVSAVDTNQLLNGNNVGTQRVDLAIKGDANEPAFMVDNSLMLTNHGQKYQSVAPQTVVEKNILSVVGVGTEDTSASNPQYLTGNGLVGGGPWKVPIVVAQITGGGGGGHAVQSLEYSNDGAGAVEKMTIA